MFEKKIKNYKFESSNSEVESLLKKGPLHPREMSSIVYWGNQATL